MIHDDAASDITFMSVSGSGDGIRSGNNSNSSGAGSGMYVAQPPQDGTSNVSVRSGRPTDPAGVYRPGPSSYAPRGGSAPKTGLYST